MVDDNNFYLTFGWMLNRLKLKGSELTVFAIIYSFTQDGVNWFTGSLKYICDFTNLSKQTVITSLKALVKKDYIIKEQKIVNNVTYNAYQVNLQVVKKFEWGSQNSLMGWSKNLNGGSQNFLPNNKEYIEIDNKEIDYSAVVKAFNSICTSLPKVKMLTDTRKTHINTFLGILKKYDLSVNDYFKRVEASDFLSGRNGQWENCSFDWLITRGNALKVCENNYKNKRGSKPQTYCEY